ncbi:MAG: hypothetical protein HZA46_02165 [Planctomycetales bacterium]|nr:hypothetical protein [Planctomycetales bacterium]
MQPVSSDTFGPLVAYLAPGATVLLGVSQFSPLVRSWFLTVPDGAPTIGGFLYLTVASMAVGMTVSAVRWIIVDTIHSITGLKLPPLDFSRLDKNVAAFGLLIDIHYRHFLFYSNSFVATAIAYGCYRVKHGWTTGVDWLDLGFIVLEVVFFAASRNTLARYYSRSQALLSRTSHK